MFFTHQRILLQQREERSAGPEWTDHGWYGVLESAQQANEATGAAHQRASDAVRAAGRRGRVHAPARHTADDPGIIECCKHRLHLLLKYLLTNKYKFSIIFFFFFRIFLVFFFFYFSVY